MSGRTDGELHALGGLSKDGRELALLVSNFNASASRLDIEIENLPWTGPGECELLLLDESRNLTPVRKERSGGPVVRFAQDLPAPGVLLLYVRPLVQ